MTSNDKSEVIVLVENTTYNPFLCAKHGLALGFFHHGEWILLDTGPDGSIIANARHLGFPLKKVSHLVLSHGHYDHTGGLEALFLNHFHPTLWVHPLAQKPKYRSDGSFIGMTLPPAFQNVWTPVERPTEILPGLWVLPPAEIIHTDDTHFDNLLVEESGQKEGDTFEDELSLVIDHGESISLFTGCAHRGITNIIEQTLSLFDKPLQLVMGGFHLRHTPTESRRVIIERLKSYPVSHYAACHCTGIEAYHEMKTSLGKRVEYASTGSRFHLLP
jgi:7,8-dihydropterin-6-yl-methyl-4-(beta-D-ribofuranosyl)aminobenzene 5'-phosphate synthase